MNGLPFQNNSIDVAAEIARQAHVHRQRMFAAISISASVQPPPLPLLVAAENPDTAKVTGAVMSAEGNLRADAFIVRPPLGDPPKIADFLLTLLARSKYSRAAVGCINERFADDCVKLGVERARLHYCAETVQFIWYMGRRFFGRVLLFGLINWLWRRFIG